MLNSGAPHQNRPRIIVKAHYILFTRCYNHSECQKHVGFSVSASHPTGTGHDQHLQINNPQVPKQHPWNVGLVFFAPSQRNAAEYRRGRDTDGIFNCKLNCSVRISGRRRADLGVFYGCRHQQSTSDSLISWIYKRCKGSSSFTQTLESKRRSVELSGVIVLHKHVLQMPYETPWLEGLLFTQLCTGAKNG